MRDVLVSPVFCVAQECRNEITKDGMCVMFLYHKFCGGTRMTGVKRNTKMTFLYHAFCVAQELRETKKEKMAQEWRKTKEAKMPCFCG